MDEILKEEPINVLIKTNDKDEIIEIGSSIFIKDPTNYIVIDSGFGDKYAHAQSQYLKEPLINDNGKYNYKYTYGNIFKNI